MINQNPEHIPTVDTQEQFIKKIDDIMAKNPLELTFEEICYIVQSTKKTQQQCLEVANRGGAKIALKLLQTRNLEIIEQVFKIIGNISIDSEQHSEQIITSGGMDKIFLTTQQLNSNTEIFHIGLWALSHLIQTKVDFSLIAPTIRYFCQLIVSQQIADESVLEDCIEGILAKHRKAEDQIRNKNEIIIETNLISKLLQLIHHHRKRLVGVTLRLLLRIGMGSEEQNEYFLSYGVIRGVSFLLISEQFIFRQRVCCLYFNIVADSQKQAIFLLEHEDIIDNLFAMFKCDCIQIGEQIASIFSLMVQYDLGCSAFEVLFQHRKLLLYYAELMLRCESIPKYLEAALKHFYQLLKNCSGTYKKFIHVERAIQSFDYWTLLATYQTNDNKQVRQQATKILHEYSNIIKQPQSKQLN